MVSFMNTVAEHWFDWQIAMLWQTAVLIGIVWIVDVLIRKWAHPQVRYALWMLVLVKLLIPPTWTSPASVTSHIPGLAVTAANRAATVMERAETQNPATPVIPGSNRDKDVMQNLQRGQDARVPLPASDTERINANRAATVMERADVTKPVNAIELSMSNTKPCLSWQTYAMLTWLAGMIVLSAWLILRLSGLRREHLKNRQNSVLPERFYRQLEETAAKLGLKCLPRVVLTDKVACPAVFGVFRPVLLMPAEKFKTMSRQDTEHILLHELAHIKRGDLLVHAVYMLAQIAYWFNPLLWMIRKTLQNLRELCCDATVAKLLREDTVHYRQTLLETARRLLAEPVDPGLGLLGLFENNNWLLTRLQWLEKNTWKNRSVRIIAIILLVAIMIACVLPMAKAERADSIIIAKEYRLIQPLGPGEGSMMNTVSGALDSEISNLVKGLLGQDTSRDYGMWEYKDAGKMVLAATGKQHQQAEKALQKKYGKLLRPETLYDLNDVQTIEIFAEKCREITRDTFKRLNFIFLTEEDIDFVVDDLGDFIRQYTRSDVPKEIQLRILEELDAYLYMWFSSTPLNHQEEVYLRFDNKIKDLKLKLWQVIANEPLTTEQKATLAEQKQWIYEFVEENFPTTSELDKVRRMYRADRVFNDVLNGFSQQPMAEETFKKLRDEILEEDSVGGVAMRVSCWSTKIGGYESSRHRDNDGEWKFPFGIVRGFSGGSDNVHFSFKSEKPYIHNSVHLWAASDNDNHHPNSYHIADKGELRSPADCTTTEQLISWIERENRGDIYYDKQTDSVVCCRGAKMTVLDVNNWIESDRISTSDLRERIQSDPITTFCVSDYWNLGDTTVGSQKPKPPVPLLAIESREGAIAVIGAKNLKQHSVGSLRLEIRHRSQDWRQQWFSTFLTGVANETIGQRHMSAPTPNSDLTTTNYTATLPNGVTVELLGVCQHPSEGKQWWSPDGPFLDEAPFDYQEGDRVYAYGDDRAYDFAVRYTNIAEDMDSIFYAEPSTSSLGGTLSSDVKKNGKPLQNYQNGKLISTVSHLATVFDKNRETCDIKIGIADGPWLIHAQSVYHGEDSWDASTQSRSDGGIIFARPIVKQNRSWITITHTIDTKKNDVRFIAITQEDKELKPVRSEGGGVGDAMQYTVLFDHPLEQLKAFQVQVRKYEWYEFKDVPLRPVGAEYDVTGTVTDAETGEPIAGVEVFDDGYNDSKFRTTTNKNGRFTLFTAKEEHNVSAKADSYEKQTKVLTTFPFANNKTFDFELTRLSVAVSERILLPEYFESHTVLSLKTGQLIPQQQADESEEPYLSYGCLAPMTSENYTTYNAPDEKYGVEACNMDLGGSEWAPESKLLSNLWELDSIDQLPKFQPTGKFTYDGYTSNGIFVSLPPDKQWPYITAFKGDDGTCGVFEITKVKGRKIYIRFKTLNPPEEAQDPSYKSVGKIRADVGQAGTITAEHGSSVFGNTALYTEELYRGRAKSQVAIKLMDTDVILNQFDTPIIKVHFPSSSGTVSKDTTGWVLLMETSFADQFVPEESSNASKSEKAHRSSELSTTNYTATLPNGVTVELVGVCKVSDKEFHSDWWSPDGRPLSEEFYNIHANKEQISTYYPYAWTLIYKIHNQPQNKSIQLTATNTEGTIKSSGPVSAAIERNGKKIDIDGTGWITIGLDIPLDSKDITLGISVDDWQIIAAHPAVETHEQDGWTIKEVAWKTEVDFPKSLLEHSSLRDRVVAIDKSGVVRKPGKLESTPQGYHASFAPTLKDLKEIQIRKPIYEWLTFKDVALRPGGEREGGNKVNKQKVYLPDLESKDAKTVLDLASGQMLSAEGMEEDRQYFEKLGKGDLVYEYAQNKSGLLCLRGAKMQLRTDSGLQPTTPEVQRAAFDVYFLKQVPCQYQVTTAEGHTYEIKILSIKEGDDGGAEVEFWKSESPGGQTEREIESPVLSLQHSAGESQNSELTATNYTATLPNDITVSLLGVADIPADSTQWWSADGTPIDSVYWEGTTHTKEEAKDARQIVMRYNSPETDPEQKPFMRVSVDRHSVGEGPGSYIGVFIVERDGQTLEDHGGCSFSLHDDHPTVDITATIDYGPWQTLTTQSAKDQRYLVTHLTTAGTVIFNDPVEKDGKATVSLTLLAQIETSRIVAIDKQGKTHTGSVFSSGMKGSQITPEHQIFKAEFYLPLSEIDKFEFQTRKSQKVTFKNVSLYSGRKTDVGIESSVSSPQSSEKNAEEKTKVSSQGNEEIAEVLDGAGGLGFEPDDGKWDHSEGIKVKKLVQSELSNWAKQQGYNSEIWTSLYYWKKHNTLRGEFRALGKSGWVWNQPKQAPPEVFLKVDKLKDGMWYLQGIDKNPTSWASSLRLELLIPESGQISNSQRIALLDEARKRFSAVRLPNPKWTRTLPNGVVLEFAGITEFPDPGRQWWTPDGKSLGYDPAFGICQHENILTNAYHFVNQPGKKRYEAAFAVS